MHKKRKSAENSGKMEETGLKGRGKGRIYEPSEAAFSLYLEIIRAGPAFYQPSFFKGGMPERSLNVI